MNKIDKFLRKLESTERKNLLKVLEIIYSGNIKGLDIKKLKGYDALYRARVGKIRVVFSRVGDDILINRIEFRGDNTYN